MHNELGNTLEMTLPLVTSKLVSFWPVKPVIYSVSLTHGAELTVGPRYQPPWVYRPGAPSCSTRLEI